VSESISFLLLGDRAMTWRFSVKRPIALYLPALQHGVASHEISTCALASKLDIMCGHRHRDDKPEA
jgi:hypothetical protein